MNGAHLGCFGATATDTKQQKKHGHQAIIQSENDIAHVQTRLSAAAVSNAATVV
jgi:hypothetical protein